MRTRVAMFAAIAAVLCVVAVPTGAASRLPGVLWHDGGRAGAFLVRPGSIYTTEDGSGVEGVLHRGGATTEHGAGRGSLRWRSWTSRSADGVGTQWIKLGTPSASSPFTREPLRVTLSRVRSGHFTRMQLRFVQHGRAERVTECLLPPYRGSYEWGTVYHGRCM